MRAVYAPESAPDSAPFGLLGQPEGFELVAHGVIILGAERDLRGLTNGKPSNGTAPGDFVARLRNSRQRRLVTYPAPVPGLRDVSEMWSGDQLTLGIAPPEQPQEPEWLLPVNIDEVTLAVNGAAAGVLEVQKLLAAYGNSRDVGLMTHPLRKRHTDFQRLSTSFTEMHRLPLDPGLFAYSE